MSESKANVPLLRIAAVSKVYERGGASVLALDGVDLTIERGEYVALLGPSGSGKSTLMHVLGCLDLPSAGSYELAGRAVHALAADDLAAVRQGIGFVFQAFHLLPRLTALENVALPLRYRGLGPDRRLALARALLARVGLDQRTDHLPSELSGGQQQRVAIARALVGDPQLVLADEPTGNLDSKAGAEIIDLLESLCAEGRTVVVVTHDERLAGRAHRIVRMLDGRVVADQRNRDRA